VSPVFAKRLRYGTPPGIVVHLPHRCTVMPTVNPRINVTLSVSLDQLVQRMSVHTRVSKSQVLRELLEAAEPALQRAVALMDAATSATESARARIGQHMQAGVAKAEDALAGVLHELDRAGSDLVTQAEAVRGKRPASERRAGKRAAERRASPPAASRVPKDPPASNRGVKSPPNRKTGGKHVAPSKVRRSS